MKRLALAVLALTVAALFVPAQANAQLPDEPVRSCPGATPNDVPARNAMFCAARTPQRTEGSYFVNYVGEVADTQQFCQLRHLAAGDQTECHPYWPFVNPTVNPDLAPASAFTSARLTVSTATAGVLVQTIDRQDRRIHRLQRELRRLRHHR